MRLGYTADAVCVASVDVHWSACLACSVGLEISLSNNFVFVKVCLSFKREFCLPRPYMFYWNHTIIILGPLQVVEVWKVKVSLWLLEYREAVSVV